MQCQSEEDCSALVRLLPTTEGALLDWAINLMADVVQQEHFNKMNAHNIAMVFAPNMTQVSLNCSMRECLVMHFPVSNIKIQCTMNSISLLKEVCYYIIYKTWCSTLHKNQFHETNILNNAESLKVPQYIMSHLSLVLPT